MVFNILTIFSTLQLWWCIYIKYKEKSWQMLFLLEEHGPNFVRTDLEKFNLITNLNF